MDLLRRAISQLNDLYRSMTPGSRLSAGLLAAAIVVGLGYIGTHQVVRPDSDLMHGQPIAINQLQLMEAALGKAKLSYVIQGSSIFVPRGQEGTYMAALRAANALPPGLSDAQRDSINSGSILEVGSHREERVKVAKQETVASAIRSRPGIEDASVIYDVSKPGGFEQKVATAIAYVKPTGSNRLDEAMVIDIRNDVVGAYAGLKPENVTVSDRNGRTWCGTVGSADEIRYRSTKRDCEQDLKAKILDALHCIPNVTVVVNVALDRTVRPTSANSVANQQSRAIPLSPNNRSRRSSDSSKKSDVTKVLDSLLGGSSGESDNAPPQPTAAVDSHVERESIAMTLASARVVINVPLGYFKQLWQQRNPTEPSRAEKTPDPAELDRIRTEECASIQRCVVPLLPPAKDAASLAEMVTVTTYQEIAATPPTPVFDWAQSVQSLANWATQSWKTLAAVAFGLVCLLVLRSIAWSKSVEEVDGPAELEVSKPLVAAAPAKPAKVASPHWLRESAAVDRLLREEISELVEDDPESAANILRNWIDR